MSARSALIFCLSLLGISIGGLLVLTQVSKAQEQSCATVERRLNEAKQLGLAESEILVVDDIEFINDYTKVLGLGIPDDSAPKHLLVTFGDQAYVGLVEQDGCIRYEVAVPINLHVRALKAATAGV